LVVSDLRSQVASGVVCGVFARGGAGAGAGGDGHGASTTTTTSTSRVATATATASTRVSVVTVRRGTGLGARLGRLFEDYGMALVFAGICILFTIWTKGLFIRPDNIVNVLRQISINACIATGMTFVIITGGVDLSVGSVLAVVGIVTAKLLTRLPGVVGVPPAIVASCIVGLMIGGVMGAVNGFTITRFRVPPFVSTLAMMTAARGIAFLLSDGRPVWNLPLQFNFIGRGYVLDKVFGPWIPMPVVIMVVVMAIAHIILTRTQIGRYVYAVGGNEEAARLSGINVARVKMFTYSLSGVTAALGGIILISRLASGQPGAGESYELYAIAATVLGGTSMSGGKGTMVGTAIGALIMGVLNNGLNLAGVESYSQNVILGAVILGAVLIDRLRKGA
ncbi:MAG: ABC transporter permease, partial [Betaproteobacteria bacterium]